jgi:hypothetical protein
MNQEDLADRAKISVRHLRKIELQNHLVPTTHITAIAAALGVNAGDITVSTPDASPTKLAIATGVGQGRAGFLLKLRVARSVTELSDLAERASRYEWRLKVDPSTATAGDMRAVLTIVKRMVAWERPDEDSTK